MQEVKHIFHLSFDISHLSLKDRFCHSKSASLNSRSYMINGVSQVSVDFC
jgi:hypothetical protein